MLKKSTTQYIAIDGNGVFRANSTQANSPLLYRKVRNTIGLQNQDLNVSSLKF